MRELALHVLDMLQNAVEAGATCVELTLREDSHSNRLTCTVRDNGRGMDDATLARVMNPFFTSRTTRHVGLGLPLVKAAAERAGGGLTISSQPGVGTTVEAAFALRHPDRQPLGDMADTLLAFILSATAPDLRYSHSVDDTVFEFDTAEMRAALDGLAFVDPTVRRWLAEFLAEGEAELSAARPNDYLETAQR